MGYRGQRKHLKRINAPHHWMLGKLNGIWVSSLLSLGTQALSWPSQAEGLPAIGLVAS